MVFSYSQIAAPSADTPKVISIASPTATEGASAEERSTPANVNLETATAAPQEGSSQLAAAAAAIASPVAGPSKTTKPQLKHLILDAGPLLSLTPLRHTAEYYHTTPAVLAELRDPKAREYWDRLGLSGVDVKVEQPSGEAMARVTAFARKTGDYAVLSTTDLGVVALTLQYELRENGERNVRSEPGQQKKPATQASAGASSMQIPDVASAQGTSDLGDGAEGEESSSEEEQEVDEEEIEESVLPEEEAEAESEQTQSPDVDRVTDGLASARLNAPSTSTETASDIRPSSTSEAESTAETASPAAEAAGTAPVDEDDDPQSDGEWITPSNLAKHRSKDLGLLPTTSANAAQAQLSAAAMTGDFAVQNVLLAMGLGLVGEGGKRIAKVKSWVLRCHACFKICRDPSKRFCPTCGGATLMRTNVTTTANGKMHLHLKSNYQYNLRGTKYTIPDAKPGRAKGQIKAGTGLILREDQREWSDAVRLEEGRRRKEEKKAARGGNWDDPDWLPEIITVGTSGKGRSGGQGMPSIGHGRKNPNVARRKR